MLLLHFCDTTGWAAQQETEFESGRFKDLWRHAFSEVAAAAPLFAKTPLLPLEMSSGDGQYRSRAV